MAGYRFQVTMSMCFTVYADDCGAAQQRANEFVDSFALGTAVGPNCGDFSDAEARVYSNDPDLELIDVDTDCTHEEQA